MPQTPDLYRALDPAVSVVVEACAGSGKTWLLVSRLLRLLLAGAEPSSLLAITYTRKAAGEMQARLDTWLEDLACLPDAEAAAFLMQRGLNEAQARAALPRARELLETVLNARPGPLITTFHGWFFHVLGRAPLTLRRAEEVAEHPTLLEQEAWSEFLRRLGRDRGGAAEQAFAGLAAEMPLATLRGLLQALLARRAEWAAYAGDDPEAPARAQQELIALTGVEEEGDPVGALLDDLDFQRALAEYRPLLEREAARGVKEAARLDSLHAHDRAASAQARLDGLTACLLTESKPRVLKLTKALQQSLGNGDADNYVALHQDLADRLVQALGRRADQRALRLQRLGLTCGLAWVETFAAVKAQRGVLDFTDAEVETLGLLEREGVAEALMMKLDARWKHLLLDEFQDANPVQWRILRAWLEAYGADGERPTVFLVGDPKQSIYRFRRAEPRLFDAAAAWLAQRYQAERLPQNETRRCAPRIVAWVNRVFGDRADYPVFQAHTAHQTGLPGWCEVYAAPPMEAVAESIPFRRPLEQPAPALPHKRAGEAAWVAQRVSEVAGRLMIQDAPDAPPRPAAYGDILVLFSKRTDLEVFEAAFREAGIPYRSNRRGALLETLEARDILALLTCLIPPHDNLPLAQTLRSPLFGLTNADLQHLASGGAGIPPSPPLGKGGVEPRGDAPTLAEAAFPLWKRGNEGDLSVAGLAAVAGIPPGPPFSKGGVAWRHRLDAWADQAEAPERVQRAARLLSRWRDLAGHLPVHDLLDRIYHERDVLARYAAALPPERAQLVLANLEELPGLALKLSGGRYPSLPRFLDEARRLRDQAGDDAPDEPLAGGDDAVRMLTIHGAKGLEAPVVFLIKADATEGREDHAGVLLDWPPEADRPEHFSLYGPSEWRGPGRDALFAAETAQAQRESLNLLYVAMTRARQALFVSGLATKRETRREGWLGQLKAAHDQVVWEGLPVMAWTEAGAAMAAAPLTGLPDPKGLETPAVGVRRDPEMGRETPQTRHGTLLHAWLERHLQGWSEEVIRARLGDDRNVAAQARSILAIPELAPAFDPARHLRARNEMECLDPEGRLLRMDRVVEFSDQVWVLDYKSGALEEPDPIRRAEPYREQMAAYRAVLEPLYTPRPVRCVLVFADGKTVWV